MKEFEDRLAKYVAGNLFADYARVEAGTELLPNSFRADVFFIPNEVLPQVPGAGLLTRLTQDARCLIEPFSGSVAPERFEANLCKLRLALYRAHKDELGVKNPNAVLWMLTTYWPQSILDGPMEGKAQTVEKGLLKWEGFPRETVYLVNSAELALREETIFFHLFGKKESRKKAVVKIFTEHLEPYVTLLNQFDMEIKKMAETGQLNKMASEDLANLIDLRDTRAEVLHEIGLKEGEKEGEKKARQEIAKKMLEEGEAPEKIASFTGLSLKELQKLQ